RLGTAADPLGYAFFHHGLGAGRRDRADHSRDRGGGARSLEEGTAAQHNGVFGSFSFSLTRHLGSSLPLIRSVGSRDREERGQRYAEQGQSQQQREAGR